MIRVASGPTVKSPGVVYDGWSFVLWFRRLGTPADIAHAAGYFLDDKAGFVTGQVLYVCGGLTVGTAGV